MGVAYTCFVSTQGITLLLGLIGFAGAFISLFTSLNVFSKFFPNELLYVLGVYSSEVMFVAFFGLMTIICSGKCCLQTLCYSLFVVLSGLQILVNFAAFVIFVLFLRQSSGLLGSLEEKTFTSYGADLPGIAAETANVNEWISVQNTLSCCGVDFPSAFEEVARFLDDGAQFDQLGANFENLTAILTGDLCQSGFDILVNLVDSFGDDINSIPEINETNAISALNQIAVNNTTNAEAEFFCLVQLEDLRDRVLRGVVVAMGVIVFFETLAFLCACAISIYVDKNEDGKLDFDNEEANRFDPIVLKISANVLSLRRPVVTSVRRVMDTMSSVPGRRQTFQSRSTATLGEGKVDRFESADDNDLEEFGTFGSPKPGIKRPRKSTAMTLDPQPRSNSKWGASFKSRNGRSGVLSMIAPFSRSKKDIKASKDLDIAIDDVGDPEPNEGEKLPIPPPMVRDDKHKTINSIDTTL